VVAFALVGFFLRSFSASESNGLASPTAEIFGFVLGVWLPLFALIYACVRNRVAVVVLAFCVGLSVNLVFLTHATPVAAVTDNSSVFTFRSTSSFGSHDMIQNYTPASGTAATCPANQSASWACGFTSDTFTTGQTMSAGTAQADLYLENQPSPANDATNGWSWFASSGTVEAVPMTKMTNLQSGDVIIAHLSIRGGTSLGTITKPSSSWNLVDRVDSGTSVTLAVYSLVAGSSEPASYTWSWTGAQRAAAVMRNFSGVDTSAPVDGHAGASESSASTTHVAPSVNAAYASETRVVGIAVSNDVDCNTIGGWNLTSVQSSGGSGSSQATAAGYAATASLPAGPTGTFTATCGNAIGATHQLTLKPSPTPSCTVTTTLRKTTPIELRAATTKKVDNGTSIVLDVPAGTQQNDLMYAILAWNSFAAPTDPGGWTLQSSNGASGLALQTYRRIASASEPATYTWTFDASVAIAGWMGSYIGVDTTTPSDFGASNSQNGTTHTTGSFSTSSANDLLVAAYSLAAISTFSTPGGLAPQGTLSAGGSPAVSLAVFDTIQGNAGTVPQMTTTTSASAQGTNRIHAFRPIASNTVTLGTANTTLGSIASPTLRSVSIPTSAATFATGERLVLEVSVPNDKANCGVRLSYDEAATPSKLTVAAEVPEGVAGLLLLAPALPVGLRWWKRRQP
jgi:hypothetical protein